MRYYTIVLYNTRKVEQRPNAFIVAHMIETETETAILLNSNQLDRRIATTRDTKFCKWLQQLYPDSGYEAKLEDDPVDKNEDGGGGSTNEFDRVDIYEGVDGIHDDRRISSRPRR